RSVGQFEKSTGIIFTDEEKRNLENVITTFPLSITPYYASLIEIESYANDPIFMQSFPSVQELTIEPWDMHDPLSEDKYSPVHGITHRYPDRVLFHISNTCAM